MRADSFRKIHYTSQSNRILQVFASATLLHNSSNTFYQLFVVFVYIYINIIYKASFAAGALSAKPSWGNHRTNTGARSVWRSKCTSTIALGGCDIHRVNAAPNRHTMTNLKIQSWLYTFIIYIYSVWNIFAPQLKFNRFANIAHRLAPSSSTSFSSTTMIWTLRQELALGGGVVCLKKKKHYFTCGTSF